MKSLKNKTKNDLVFSQFHGTTEVKCVVKYLFTLTVSNMMFYYFQAGQYTSIFVDNAAGASITIQNGSDFMGMLLGV